MTAYCVFHGQDRDAQDDQEEQVHQNEKTAAVLTGYVRKPPDVAEADRAAGREKDEAEAGT